MISLIKWGNCFFFFFFNDTAATEIYTLSQHDALPICLKRQAAAQLGGRVLAHLVLADNAGAQVGGQFLGINGGFPLLARQHFLQRRAIGQSGKNVHKEPPSA